MAAAAAIVKTASTAAVRFMGSASWLHSHVTSAEQEIKSSGVIGSNQPCEESAEVVSGTRVICRAASPPGRRRRSAAARWRTGRRLAWPASAAGAPPSSVAVSCSWPGSP